MRLRRAAAVLATVTAVGGGLAAPAAQAARHPDGMDIRAGAMHGVVPAKGVSAAHTARRSSSPNMLFHNGEIMPSAAVQAIYWGTTWPQTGAIESGLQSFYTGFSNSNYAKTSSEYTGTNGTVGNGVAINNFVVDNSAAPAHAPSTSTILGEVAKKISKPLHNGYYPVYTDTPRGGAQYCAWHSAGTVNGVLVQFAFFFDLTGDPGCDPGDTTTGHGQDLAALANVSAHELSEARTDPNNGGWYDSSGAENGDKCAWTFNVPSVTFSNGTQWMVQGEWSNKAYTAGTGYPNNSGQRGCLDGH